MCPIRIFKAEFGALVCPYRQTDKDRYLGRDDIQKHRDKSRALARHYLYMFLLSAWLLSSLELSDTQVYEP